MNKDIITKTIPIIESGKYGFTNYYIPPESLNKEQLSKELHGSFLIYQDCDYHQKIVGFFDSSAELKFKEKDDKVIIECKALMSRKFDGDLISKIRSDDVMFSPEIEVISTEQMENGSIKIKEFHLQGVVVYEPAIR